MTDPSTLVSTLITELKSELSQSARELKNRAEWDLSFPIVVVDARQNPRRVVATAQASRLLPKTIAAPVPITNAAPAPPSV